MIFLLGVPSTDKQRNSSLEEESVQFGDILQGDFPDSYPHLSHKVIMSFIWTNKWAQNIVKPIQSKQIQALHEPK